MKYLLLLISSVVLWQGTIAQSLVSYTYDSQGRLSSEYFPSVYKLEYSFDTEGNFSNKILTNYTDISLEQTIEYRQGIEVFPNPANEYLIVRSLTEYPISRIEVFDVSGRKMIETNSQATEIRLNTQALESSIYLVLIESAGEKLMVRVIKQ